ncbi:hypothetical protein GCM10012275_42770 [Longimycelium tulufanense]|uniref:Uncharacterized protein n=1 Tax=Longimycelium tulufanense TaxID=907463 RepID=A0A8J3CB08_9PSEU|nr:hypothetical protein [Longimycelium tulufanense]GGM67640.1 hypothetical protein GCM10012275_42770 [Longimycelium tulufanense]
MDKYGGEIPVWISASLQLIPVLIAHNRPAEAEHSLLSLEVTVGALSWREFQDRANAIVVTADDDSWERTWSLAELDALRREAGLPPRYT